MKNDLFGSIEPVDQLPRGAIARRHARTGLPFRSRHGRRLRPYQDVRAGFAPWRRVARLAWAERERASGLMLPGAAVH